MVLGPRHSVGGGDDDDDDDDEVEPTADVDFRTKVVHAEPSGGA